MIDLMRIALVHLRAVSVIRHDGGRRLRETVTVLHELADRFGHVPAVIREYGTCGGTIRGPVLYGAARRHRGIPYVIVVLRQTDNVGRAEIQITREDVTIGTTRAPQPIFGGVGLRAHDVHLGRVGRHIDLHNITTVTAGITRDDTVATVGT